MAEQLQVRVIRTVHEIEDIRGAWSAWQCHPNSDIASYLAINRLRPQILRPHVLVLYRNSRPDAMLIGRVVKQRIGVRVGYMTVLECNARVLSIAYAGGLGNLSTVNSEALVGELSECLRRGEADVATLNCVRVDSEIYQAAKRLPAFLSRDLLSHPQEHRSLVLPSDLGGFHRSLSRKFCKTQRRWRKLLQDFSGDVKIRCFREPAQLGEMMHDVEEVARKTYQRGLGVGFVDGAETREFMRLEAQEGRLRAYVLYLAGKPCAFWVGSVYRKTFYGGAVGYDPSYGGYSPGIYLMTKVIKQLCERRDGEDVEEIDFGLGDAEYKRLLGNTSWKEASVRIFSPTLKGLGLKMLCISAALVDRLGKKALEAVGALPKVKRIWRNRLQPN